MTSPKNLTQKDAAPGFDNILLALDASDHANRGITEAIRLARIWSSSITGTHVYAAQLHDNRFRQMEGGLPEQFRQESELERQRDVHEDLITRGLAIITDSYLSQAQSACQDAGLIFAGKPLEGKNYRSLIDEASQSTYDLLVMGAQGLGALENSTPGSVCRRVSRSVNLDTLVIKDAAQALDSGPILVAVDGSSRAWGGLITALELSKHWQVKIEVVSAFDPYYHYVAFNKIAEGLSEEASKVFRFKEQEKLHEEIIDSGLARIYQSHLDVATDLANAQDVEIKTTLLAGKAHACIEKHALEIGATLVIAGKTGIHADPHLDIGGNTELLLQNLKSALWISSREYKPEVEIIAEATTSWTDEAMARLEKAPTFVQGIAKAAVLRHAHERGHTVITEKMVDEVSAQMMPSKAREKIAQLGAAAAPGEENSNPLVWQAAALARLARVPAGMMRDGSKQAAEDRARAQDATEVDIDLVEQAISAAKTRMPKPVDSMTDSNWDDEATAMLQGVPAGYCRDMTRDAVNSIAQVRGIAGIKADFVAAVLATISSGSENVSPALEWSPAAFTRIQAVPESVRGMLIKEIESWVTRRGGSAVNCADLDAVKQQWQEKGVFHLDPEDSRHQQ